MAAAYSTIPDFLALDTIGNKYNKQLIIYPVFRYKIYAPVLDDIGLNIFQKNILAILNKGNYTKEEISEWLDLDVQLVQLVLGELKIKELVDNHAIINQKGKDLSNGTYSWYVYADDLKKDFRYIYQDVFTHELYPVLIDLENNKQNIFYSYNKDKNKNKLCIRSKGSPEEYDYHLIELKANNKTISFNANLQPEVQEIFEAIDKHSEIYSPNKKMNIKEKPGVVQYIENEPTLTYVATWIYIDKNSSDIDDLEVLDPFGIYTEDKMYWLKENIEKAAKENEKLQSLLDILIVDAVQKEKDRVSEVLKKLNKESSEIIAKTFDLGLKEYSTLYGSLVDFYYNLNISNYHTSANELKSAIKNGYTVLETLFKIIYDHHKIGYETVYTQNEIKKNKLCSIPVDEIELKILKINSQCIIPNWHYSSFSGNNLREATRNIKKASLRALYNGAILAASNDSNNPMNTMIKQKNDLLVFLEDVAEERNPVAHKYVEISDAKLQEYHDGVICIRDGIKEIIEIFLKGNNNG